MAGWQAGDVIAAGPRKGLASGRTTVTGDGETCLLKFYEQKKYFVVPPQLGVQD